MLETVTLVLERAGRPMRAPATVRAFGARVLLRPTEWESGALRLDGLAILEACCFVGAAGGVAGAVRVSAGARERAAIDD